MSQLTTFEQLAFANEVAIQSLNRQPEPSAVTDDHNSVEDYGRVLETNMTANYCATLDLAHRLTQISKRASALELCCGPGHLSRLLSEKLNFENVLGVDQSKPIIRKARLLTEDSKYQGRVVFRNQNVLELDRVKISPANLVLFPNAAHHFGTLEDVRSVLQVSESYIAPDGVILLTDLARLKTNKITADFVKLAGQEFKDLNMPSMYQDFHNSMYAAWLPEELATSIPTHSRLSWFQLKLPGLSCFQALFGIPKGRADIFVNHAKDWTKSDILKSQGARMGWDFLGKVLYEASPKEINSLSRAS